MTREQIDPLIMKAFTPIGPALKKARITPNQLTLLGVALSFLGAAILASGRLKTGMFVLIFTWLFDVMDGAMAKYSGQVSRFGGFLDSVMDRYTEGAVFVAFAYYYAAAGNAVMTAVTVCALIGAAAVSYARARAENEIDARCSIGIGDRLTRLVTLAVCTIFGFPEIGLVIVLLLAHYTVMQRIFFTRRALETARE